MMLSVSVLHCIAGLFVVKGKGFGSGHGLMKVLWDLEIREEPQSG